MKKLALVAVAAVATVTAMPAMAAPIVSLYNTGVTDAKAVRSNGDAETHYAIFAAPAGAGATARVATSANGYPIGPWLGDNTTSAWIGPVGSGTLDGPTGNYTYRTTFSLAGLNAATASITGRWATDDGGLNILLNGTSLNITSGSFTAWTDFTISTGFVSGLNTLDFVLNNGSGPTGLRTEMVGTADAVPEPATWAMMVLGLGMAGYGLRRRKVTARVAFG